MVSSNKIINVFIYATVIMFNILHIDCMFAEKNIPVEALYKNIDTEQQMLLDEYNTKFLDNSRMRQSALGSFGPMLFNSMYFYGIIVDASSIGPNVQFTEIFNRFQQTLTPITTAISNVPYLTQAIWYVKPKTFIHNNKTSFAHGQYAIGYITNVQLTVKTIASVQALTNIYIMKLDSFNKYTPIGYSTLYNAPPPVGKNGKRALKFVPDAPAGYSKTSKEQLAAREEMFAANNKYFQNQWDVLEIFNTRVRGLSYVLLPTAQNVVNQNKKLQSLYNGKSSKFAQDEMEEDTLETFDNNE